MTLTTLLTWLHHFACNWTPRKRSILYYPDKYPKPDIPALTAADGAPLDRVSTYKYLGLHVCATLTWSTHILSIKTKTKRLFGMLFRGYYQDCPSDILLKLYLSTVRPHMEYASCIWHPHTQKRTKMLEDVQKFTLRISIPNGGTCLMTNS